MIKKIIDYFGFYWKRNLPTKTDIIEYQKSVIDFNKGDINDEDFTKYNAYLNELIDKEEKRLQSFDPKATQIVGQTSLVLTITGLFIPIAFTNLNSSHIYLKIILVSFFLLIASLFVYAILCALRNFSVYNFKYMKGNELTIKDAYEGNIKFNNEILKDKVYELKSSIDYNNAKASNIIYAYRAFSWALIILLFYIFFYCIVNFFVKKETKNPEPFSKSVTQIFYNVDSTAHKVSLDTFKKQQDTSSLNFKRESK